MDSLHSTITHLRTKKRPLFLTTSNRWEGEGAELPKSTELAYHIQKVIPAAEVIEVPTLRIYPCEGNVSTREGNTCGLQKAQLQDSTKNPSGHHRCWASINNPDDELWKVSRSLLMSDSVLFFGSIRWGQMNSIYQTLIERLTWLENRHSTLHEENILSHIEAGIIITGHNWKGKDVLATQKEVLRFFGFQVAEDLCWNWQYLEDAENESNQAYKDAYRDFHQRFLN